MTTVYAFPGQGAQRVGMAVDLADALPAVADVFAEASEAIGLDLLDLCRHGPVERLMRTELTQPALLTASVACMIAARSWLPPPSYLVGMSLGEYTALVAGQAIGLADAVRLAHERGRLMTTVIADRPVAMIAVSGLTPTVVEELCQSVRHVGICQPALYTGKRQVTVAGDRRPIELLTVLAERANAEVTELAVSSAFHTSLMTPVVPKLAAMLAGTLIRPPVVPIVGNVTARPMRAPDQIRHGLIRQLDRPVRWSDSIHWLTDAGVDTLIQFGPGRGLARLAGDIEPGLTTVCISGLRSLRAAQARPAEPLFVPVPLARARRYRQAGYWAGESLDAALLARLEREPVDRPALVAEEYGAGQTVHCGELRTAVSRLAGHLRELGIGRSDRVVLQLGNEPLFVVLLLALWRVGATAVMALPSYGQHELRHVLTASDAVAIAVSNRSHRAGQLAAVRAVRTDLPGLRTVLTVGEVTDRRAAEIDLLDLLDPTAEPATALADRGPARPDDLALLLMSGGTTGPAKLIPRTHDDYLYNIRVSSQICGVDDRIVYGAVLPVAHNFALGCPGILGALLHGGQAVFVARPDPASVVHALDAHGATITSAVPTLAMQIADAAAAQGSRLSRLRLLQVGGARLSADGARFIRSTVDCSLQQVYGMAEGLLNFTRLDDPDDVVASTQGRPASAGDEIRIVDPSGADVPDGQLGELWARGPYTIAGYFRATATDTRATHTPDGFYRTGDLVRRHPSGNLVVEGRLKDVINRAGEKISAAELENMVLTHPAVRDAAAVAAPDTSVGESVCVFVVPHEGTAPTLRELRAFLTGRGIARYKLPERLEVVPALPVTAVGKPDKAALRRRLADSATTDRTT